MDEGLYRARFTTPLGSGCGVVTAANGVLTGGDSRSYYFGTYILKDNYLTVELHVRRHNPRVILPSVLGALQATVQLDGYFAGTQARLSGFALAKVPVKLQVVIDRLDVPETLSIGEG